MSNIIKNLRELQVKLKAPKNQRNNFGGYNYRSCEDILEAVKPLLPDGFIIYLDDEIQMIGSRFYVKAEAIFTDGKEKVSAKGYAREDEIKKGMDGSQITGAASSYARKYALNALLLIDDNKDADATNQHEKYKPVYQPKTKAEKKTTEPKDEPKAEINFTNLSDELLMRAITKYQEAGSDEEREKIESYLMSNYYLSDEQVSKWAAVKSKK